MSALSAFQDAFAAALLAPESADARMQVLAAQPGFAIYRNTVFKGCIDALQANFPAVTRLVGEEWLRAAAAVYVREHLPGEPSLLAYGDGFAAFLETFEPARELPYLAGVARLDRLWTESHAARDAARLDPMDVASLAPDVLARCTLTPHPAARWAWFDEQPVPTIWARNRTDGAFDAGIDWRGEGILLTRPVDAVEHAPLHAASCAFLDACAAGLRLDEAADLALRADPDVDLSHLMAQLLSAGAFTQVHLEESP